MSYRGWKQRAAAAEPGAPGGATGRARSKLAEKLLFDHSWGNLTASRLREYAECAVDDGLDHEILQRLADIGYGVWIKAVFSELRWAWG